MTQATISPGTPRGPTEDVSGCRAGATSQSASRTANSGTKNEPSSSRNDWNETRSIDSAPSTPMPRRREDQQPLRRAGSEVLDGDRARVGVREGVVRLGNREREQRQHGDQPTCDHGGGERRRVPRPAGARATHRGSASRRRRSRTRARRRRRRLAASARSGCSRRRAGSTRQSRRRRCPPPATRTGRLRPDGTTECRARSVERPPCQVRDRERDGPHRHPAKNRRTTPTGPSRPKTSASTPNRIVHSHLRLEPKISSERARPRRAITMSSKIVQPTHWTR